MDRNIKAYEDSYINDYEFEKILVRYRQKTVIEQLQKYRPRTVLEVGCGADLLFETYIQNNEIEQWLIIEPSTTFSSTAQNLALKKNNLTVICDFLENKRFEIKNKLLKIDLIICSALIHEVESAKSLLKDLSFLMGKHTILHINAPNSSSLHRRLAKSMKIIHSTEDLSARNTALQQHRVYNMNSLTEDINQSGLKVIDEGGIFIKPFTNNQMSTIKEAILSEDILDGLYFLGKELPEISSEIYVNAIIEN